jgi:hypothetical protein
VVVPPVVVGNQHPETIQLVFSPQRLGNFTADVVVVSDDPVRPELHLPVIAVVTQPRPPRAVIKVSPTALDFGTRMLGSDTYLPITVSNTGNRDAYASEWVLHNETPPGQFPLPFSLAVTIPPNESRNITITYRPTVQTPATAEAVFSFGVAFGESAEHTIALRGEGGAPEIRIEPNPLDFGAIAPLTSSRMTFQIHNDGNMDLTVIDIIGGPSVFTGDNVFLPASIPPGGFADIGVTFNAPNAPGRGTSVFWDIASNDPRAPRARLEMRGTAAGAHIEVIPEQIDLGSVNASTAVRAEIMNRGSASLEVRELRFEKGRFFSLWQALQLPMAIAGGQSRTITIEFTMPPAGTHGLLEDTLYIASDDALNPRYALHLRVWV